MSELDKTMMFHINKETENTTRGIIRLVCEAMREKGYDPLNQIMGYIVSGDPTYITSHNDARKLIHRLDRDELLEEFVDFYIKSLGNNGN